MAKAYHFNCTRCSFSYTGPVGHVHPSRDQVVSVICIHCREVEARRVNWTQVVPVARSISENLDKIDVDQKAAALQSDHEIMESMVKAAGNNIEWNDYSLHLEDIFTCWSCENELFIWDEPVCPYCGEEMTKGFTVNMDN